MINLVKIFDIDNHVLLINEPKKLDTELLILSTVTELPFHLYYQYEMWILIITCQSPVQHYFMNSSSTKLLLGDLSLLYLQHSSPEIVIRARREAGDGAVAMTIGEEGFSLWEAELSAHLMGH